MSRLSSSRDVTTSAFAGCEPVVITAGYNLTEIEGGGDARIFVIESN